MQHIIDKISTAIKQDKKNVVISNLNLTYSEIEKLDSSFTMCGFDIMYAYDNISYYLSADMLEYFDYNTIIAWKSEQKSIPRTIFVSWN